MTARSIVSGKKMIYVGWVEDTPTKEELIKNGLDKKMRQKGC